MRLFRRFQGELKGKAVIRNRMAPILLHQNREIELEAGDYIQIQSPIGEFIAQSRVSRHYQLSEQWLWIPCDVSLQVWEDWMKQGCSVILLKRVDPVFCDQLIDGVYLVVLLLSLVIYRLFGNFGSFWLFSFAWASLYLFFQTGLRKRLFIIPADFFQKNSANPIGRAFRDRSTLP